MTRAVSIGVITFLILLPAYTLYMMHLYGMAMWVLVSNLLVACLTAEIAQRKP